MSVSKLFILSLLPFFCLFTAAAAESSSSEQISKNLNDAIDQYTLKLKEKSPDQAPGRQNEISSYIPRLKQALQQAIARKNYNSLQQALEQVQSIVQDEAIQKLCEQLLAQLQDEIETRNKAYRESVDSTIDKAVKTAIASKAPKELDEFILELNRLATRPNEGDYSANQLTQRSAEKARSAVSFLCLWQDYLAQTSSGNSTAAQNTLRTMSQNGSYTFVPRSEIVSRMTQKGESNSNTPVKLPDLTGKTLKDLPAVSEEITALMVESPNQNDYRQFNQTLETFLRAQADFQSGQLGKTFSFCTGSSDNARSPWALLRQELLLQVLPVYLNIASEYPAKDKETPSEYLLRIIQEAKGKKDWITVWKSLEAYRGASFSQNQPPGWLSADILGYSNFISAQNYEKAGQYLEAIRYYKKTLSQPGQNLPVEEITYRLAELQKDHPADFEAAKTVEPEQARVIYPPIYPGFPR